VVPDGPVRAGFGRLAVAVAIITVLDGSEPHGCTGMAWAEHLPPALLLTTLRTHGHTRELVGLTRHFGVSVLSETQSAYAARFAAKSTSPGARFAGVPFSRGRRFGLPVLDGCVASFECEVAGIYPFGGHDIVVGQVAWASVAGEAAAAGPGHSCPLIHYDGHLWGLRNAGG
jgi:flavin reductase (DIM6/NTAB) family NADH-FMN oxidoreductase RutF